MAMARRPVDLCSFSLGGRGGKTVSPMFLNEHITLT
jgi:hypothetical protein